MVPTTSSRLEKSPATVAAGTARPEWLKLKAAANRSGLSRTYLYELIQDGKIKSALVKTRGSLKGVRLINGDSLDAFIESCAGEASQLPVRTASQK